MLVNTKFQSDGSKLQKIESFTPTSVSSGLYKDGERVGDINERLNLTHDNHDWLSLRPSGARYFKDDYFGEFSEKNNPHGRGIYIYFDGDIRFQYYHNGATASGNYIHIYKDGEFDVGEGYFKDGMKLHHRCTRYCTDGTSVKYGF